jgi:hypothetical protein
LALDPARSREAVGARIALYSPRRTAQGIINAAAALRRATDSEA